MTLNYQSVVLFDVNIRLVSYATLHIHLILMSLSNGLPILTECIDFQPIRVTYYSTSDISQLFHSVNHSSILQYMKDICLYNS